MNRTNENRNGVVSILTRARANNPEIGSYQEHFINEQFNFTVRLSNGRIVIPMTMAQDQEVQPTSISEERIQRVANGFQSNNPTPPKQTVEVHNTEETKPELSFWRRILKLIGIK
tara:strand:+ start:273 stop:617 length:345 start_codon:yes stop_codon:yes gene_type:complete